MTFRRTAVADSEIGGQPVRAGDKVVVSFPGPPSYLRSNFQRGVKRLPVAWTAA